MHGLDVIITRNAKAAGREAAHALNDGNVVRYEAIEKADDQEKHASVAAYVDGFCLGLKEN